MAQYFSIAPNIIKNGAILIIAPENYQKWHNTYYRAKEILKMAGYSNRATAYYSFSTGVYGSFFSEISVKK
jgi:hypothetical protein